MAKRRRPDEHQLSLDSLFAAPEAARDDHVRQAREEEHWARTDPARYAAIEDPEAFFSALGEQAERLDQRASRCCSGGGGRAALGLERCAAPRRRRQRASSARAAAAIRRAR